MQQKQQQMQLLIEDKRELEQIIFQQNKRTMMTMDSTITESNVREVLIEKDNYIHKLENEISQMRKEIMESGRDY